MVGVVDVCPVAHSHSLIGLLSFMCTDELTTGSVLVSARERRLLAAQSHAYNLRQRRFTQLFPEYTGPMAKEYQLTKLTSYPGKREELLINPVSVKENSPSKGLVSFDGIWNMNHATQLGHRSLASTFVLNCKGKSYTMNDVRYYAQPHLRGKLLDQSKGKGHDIPVTREDKVMTEVMDTYCSR